MYGQGLPLPCPARPCASLPYLLSPNHLTQIPPKILKQHYCRVSTRRTGDRTTWMCGSSSLIEARDRHPMLSIARNWSQRFRLSWTHVPTMATPMPVVPVDAFQVERAAHIYSEDFVVSQVRCVLPQFCQIASSNLFLDLVPLLRSLTQRVRLYVDHFNHVLAFWDTRGICYGRSQHQQHRIFSANSAVVEVAFHAQLSFGCLRHTRSNNGERSLHFHQP